MSSNVGLQQRPSCQCFRMSAVKEVQSQLYYPKHCSNAIRNLDYTHNTINQIYIYIYTYEIHKKEAREMMIAVLVT